MSKVVRGVNDGVRSAAKVPPPSAAARSTPRAPSSRSPSSRGIDRLREQVAGAPATTAPAADAGYANVVALARNRPAISAPHDAREREAEQIATAVTGASAGRSTAPTIAARLPASPVAPDASPLTPERGGQPLPAPMRALFEPRLGHSLAHVRIHTGGEAAAMADSLDARAYAVGRDIVFGAGAYAPDTPAGQRVLAHELTHVLQSPRGGVVHRLPVEPTGTPFLAEVYPADSTPIRDRPAHDAKRLADLERGHPVTVEGGRGWLRVSTGVFDKGIIKPLAGFVSYEQLRPRRDQKPDVESGMLAKLAADYQMAVEGHHWTTAAELLQQLNDGDVRAHVLALVELDRVELRRGAMTSARLAGGGRLTKVVDDLTPGALQLMHALDELDAARPMSDWPRIHRALSGLVDHHARALLDRLARSELAALRRDAPDHLATLIDAALGPKSRAIAPTDEGLLTRLTALGTAAKAEGSDGAAFKNAVDDFRKTLRFRMNDVAPGAPLPADLDLVIKALALWRDDSGTQWGARGNASDLPMTAADYVTVPASQYKCNAYVAESLYRSQGLVYKIYESDEHAGKYFPYKAADWGNTSTSIAHFTVTASPVMGDIWSNGHHTGIFLGVYVGKQLYISARNDGDGVFGVPGVQKAHGIQIKAIPEPGVFRHYTP